MRPLPVALTWLLLICSGGALAHAHLKESSPAEGSHLTSPPEALVLSFSEAAQLTALSLEKPDGSSARLTPPVQPQTRISVALPRLAAGAYVVHWRALGADGHLVPGELHFTITQ
ncbi:MAG TPA: copper resistance CopC family protein [Steroidobacteraceae bacterium]|jgi:methionine-rich copper-binding protein CopC|nr:copper resistance CopC family protein [Steroidobacteraceae bacterium]